ncbi:MAG: cellulase family glycosylhydrolase [Gemmataceae bacterium]
MLRSSSILWIWRLLSLCFLISTVTVCTSQQGVAQEAKLKWIKVSRDHKGFETVPGGKKFIPWGFNYDHDEKGELLEDYWEKDWRRVVADFGEMKELGANVVRIHLQLGKFMSSPKLANERSLRQLAKLIDMAETTNLYLDITGLGCYHKKDVPRWYDRLSETKRWDVQGRFWEAIAKTCAKSPAIFCYDLMNEPVVPGGRKKRKDWLGPGFAGNHFVQFIALETKGRARSDIAKSWIKRLVTSIRKHDKEHLITVGLVPWSLDRPGLTSGFTPEKISGELDFLSVHIYPEKGKIDEAIQTLRGFVVGKPVVIEEIFPLRCSSEELATFIKRSRPVSSGWIGFYWGRTPKELRNPKTIGEAITLQWLELFQRERRTIVESR